MILPTIDLRPDLSPVGLQGKRSCCLAFAASCAHEKAQGDCEALSIEFLHFQSVARSPGANPRGGAAMAAVADAIRDAGQPLEATWPYQTEQLVPPEWAPPTDLGEMFHADVDMQDLSHGDIRAVMDDRRPVIMGLVITQGFRAPDEQGRILVADPDLERGPHAVLGVGYGYDGNELFFLIRNSWGAHWGLDGHAWLSSQYLENQLHETAVVTKRG